MKYILDRITRFDYSSYSPVGHILDEIHTMAREAYDNGKVVIINDLLSILIEWLHSTNKMGISQDRVKMHNIIKLKHDLADLHLKIMKLKKGR